MIKRLEEFGITKYTGQIEHFAYEGCKSQSENTYRECDRVHYALDSLFDLKDDSGSDQYCLDAHTLSSVLVYKEGQDAYITLKHVKLEDRKFFISLFKNLLDGFATEKADVDVLKINSKFVSREKNLVLKPVLDTETEEGLGKLINQRDGVGKMVQDFKTYLNPNKNNKDQL